MGEVSVMVDAGKATAGAPLGPALGPLGVNIGEVVKEINEKTQGYKGMKVPVKVIVDSNKNFQIKVGSPPTSALIKKEINLQKGAANPKEPVGDISLEQIKKLAEMKLDGVNSTSVKKAANEIMGVCNSMGVTVNGKRAKQVIQEVNEGQHDSLFAEKKA
jgi:large subunit ribosomal protein L11